MTTANKITILRILLTPFFASQAIYYVREGDEIFRLTALLSFWIAAILDGVDGYIARRYNQKTELGALLDPLADKLLLVTGLVVLTFDNSPRLDRIPLWCTATVIGRDVILLLGVLVINHLKGDPKIQPRLMGKCATFFQMALIIHTLLKWPTNGILAWAGAATFCTAVSCILYIIDGTKQVPDQPPGEPPKDE